MSQIDIINEINVQQIDYGEGLASYAQVIVVIPVADANRLAQHYTDRTAAGLDILSSEAKEIAKPTYAALAAAGYGE